MSTELKRYSLDKTARAMFAKTAGGWVKYEDAVAAIEATRCDTSTGAGDVSKTAPNLDTLAERVYEARISALEEAAKAAECSAYMSKQMGHEDLYRGAMNAVNAIRALYPSAATKEPT